MSNPLDLNDLAIGPAVKPMTEWKVPTSKHERADQSPFETIWLRFFAWVFFCLGITYYFWIHRDFTVPEIVFSSSVEVMILIGLSQLALHFLYWQMANKIILGFGLKRLSTKVPNEGACPVSIEIYQKGVITGYDEGYFWFQDGTLFFKGLQSVFRLNSTDLEPKKLWPRKQRPNLDAGRPPRWLRILGSSDSVQLRFKLLDPFEDYGARRRSANFDREMSRWLIDRPSGSLESRLPPETLHPALTSIGPLRYEGVVAGTILCCANLALVLTAKYQNLPNNIGAIGYVLPIGIGFVFSSLALRMCVQNVQNIKFRTSLASTARIPLIE